MPTGTLKGKGKKLWEQVYKDSTKAGDKPGVAAQKAWGAVKNAGWKKVDGNWVKKSDAVVEFSMYISKSVLDGNVMRWAAVNSDTDKDLYAERMSVELYQDFLKRIRNNEDIPLHFRSLVSSDYWQKGMPYVSISHYSDLNGEAVPGKPTEIYIDGDKLKARLKAKGILYDTPLGRAVWKSLKEDKNKNPEERIRISIGFLDLEHKHGENGSPFKRESIYSLCPQCLDGVGEKIYTKGYLVHLALTRVPVNQRTEIVLEEKSDMSKKRTRKEDAASIVGEDLAETIENRSKTVEHKSDILIEMSDTEPTEEETRELIEGVENEEEESVSDSVSAEDAVVTESEAKDAPPVVEKFEDATMDNALETPPAVMDNLPYGGATSMKDAEEYANAKNEMIYLMDMWSVFCSVVCNIFERQDVPNKREALNAAVDEFKNVLTLKAMVTFSNTNTTNPVVPEEKPQHELQPAIDLLLQSVDNSLSLKSDSERAEVLNPVLQELGKNIMGYLESKSVVEETEQPVSKLDNDTLLKEMKQIIQPLSETIQALVGDVELLKSKSQAGSVEVKQPSIPKPRTFPSVLVNKSTETNASTPKPGSLKDIIRKSVGIND